MSFKGIAWVGNVYGKFEAMCLEVEEAIYQDSVKYMENQVQKVGVSVKKFYSEVMDDLRPLSCVDPMSLPSSDDVSHLSHGLTNKKPISKKVNEDQVFSPQSPGIFIENISKCGASKGIGVNRRPIGIKRISRKNPPSEESVSDRRSKDANCNMRSSSSLASDNRDVTTSSDLTRRSETGEAVEGNRPINVNSVELPLSSESVTRDASIVGCDDTNVTSSSSVATHLCDNVNEPPASEKVSVAESLGQMEHASDCISFDSGNKLSDESLRLKEDPDSTSSCSGLQTESTDNLSMRDGSSRSSSIACDTGPCNKDLIVSEDSFEMEFVENEEVKLEESCILVEGDELHYALQGTRKHKSYKKRIREALSSKMKSRNDDHFVSQPKREEENKKNLSAQDSVESDWEIL